jgi:Raf kinase inhibitor-like YbhB/YbcL family protein
MELADKLKHAAGSAMKFARAGTDQLCSRKLGLTNAAHLDLTSSDFQNQAPLPTRATSDGDGTPPPISWSDPPTGTVSFVLICEDPDAPLPEPFVHWIVYGIPSKTRCLDANVVGFQEGKNSRLSTGFTPAAPPPGHGTHHYHFQLFALDKHLNLPEGIGRGELVSELTGHVLAWGEIVGSYEHR